MPRKNRDSFICASIETATEERATSSLKVMSLSISKVPNAATRKAIEQIEKGKGKRSASVRALFKSIGIRGGTP